MTDKTTTILVIEDESIVRETTSDYLEDLNYEVIQAENGRIGLELFNKKLPDLVLTDLRMPELDGLEVLSEITKISPYTPIIVISGTGEIKDVLEAMHLGAWDYILKPITDMSIISHTIKKSFERSNLLIENKKTRSGQ